MKLLKKDIRRCGLRVATLCVVLGLTVFFIGMSTQSAVGALKTVAEIALYGGPDREKMLIKGAKKEGQLIFYTTQTWLNTGVVKEFEKKYPFVKVSSWRSDTTELLKRVLEEYAARRFLVDVIEAESTVTLFLHRDGILQEYYSPEAAYYGDEVKRKGKTGVYFMANRELYFSLGFNTHLVSRAEAPKTLKDLLDPKWKGKMSIAGSSTGVRWIGNALEAMGRDFIEKMSRQNVKVQNMSGAALAGLIASGEVPISPTGAFSSLTRAKQKGAPVHWRPLEPVQTNVGFSGMTTKAPHPHTGLLFLDYIHSREGQNVVMQGGMLSPRVDMGSSAEKYWVFSPEDQKFKRSYPESKYSLEEYDKKFNEWQELMRQLFIRVK